MKSQGAAKNEANNAAQSGAATVAATEEAAPQVITMASSQQMIRSISPKYRLSHCLRNR